MSRGDSCRPTCMATMVLGLDASVGGALDAVDAPAGDVVEQSLGGDAHRWIGWSVIVEPRSVG